MSYPEDLLESVAPPTRGPSPDTTATARAELLALINGRGAAVVARPSRRRRQALAFAAVAGTVVLSSGLAAATGVIPDGVLRHFALVNDKKGLRANPVLARRLATAVAPSGLVFELWTAPNESGGSCTYLRQIARGRKEDGSLDCRAGRNVRAYPDAPITISGETLSSGDEFAWHGTVPAATTEVDIHFADGSAITVPSTNGAFLVVLPVARRTSLSDPTAASEQPVRLVARNSGGVLATRELAHPS